MPGDRPQPVDQRLGAVAQVGEPVLDPADLAEQGAELALDGDLAVGLAGGDARHVGERAQPPPGEGAGDLGVLELAVDIGALGRLGRRAVCLEAGNQGLGSGWHGGKMACPVAVIQSPL